MEGYFSNPEKIHWWLRVGQESREGEKWTEVKENWEWEQQNGQGLVFHGRWWMKGRGWKQEPVSQIHDLSNWMNRGSILLWSWIRDSADLDMGRSTGFKHVTFCYASEIDKWICLMDSLVLRYFILSNLVCPRLPTIEDETSHCFREGQTQFRTEIRISLVFKLDHLKKKKKKVGGFAWQSNG